MKPEYIEQETFPSYDAQVLTGPQVCFPFPGEAEINIVVKLLNLDESSDDTPSTIIVPAIIDKHIPSIGDRIKVEEYYDFYYGKRDGIVRNEAPPRYHIK